MYKCSDFNTWLNKQCDLLHQEGTFDSKGPFLTAPPLHPLPLAPPPRAAMNSMCLGFQGLQSVWGWGHAGPVSRPVQGSDRAQPGGEEIRWTDPKLHPGPQTANRRFRESKISFVPPVPWGLVPPRTHPALTGWLLHTGRILPWLTHVLHVCLGTYRYTQRVRQHYPKIGKLSVLIWMTPSSSSLSASPDFWWAFAVAVGVLTFYFLFIRYWAIGICWICLSCS